MTSTLPLVPPLVFLPFHLAGHHLTARAFDHKRVTYPAHLLLTLVQFVLEHYTAHVPALAPLSAPLTMIAIGLAPYFFNRALKKTTGPKSHVWAAIGMFVA